MIVSLVVARSENGVIGRDNQLPWSLPADLRHFRRVTMGHPMVMGRRTHESIGRPLPGRHNIVLSRDRRYRAPGCSVVGSWEEARELGRQDGELMVVGGESLYRLTLAEAERIYLTEVHAVLDGGVHFPELHPGTWLERSRERHPADSDNEYACSFVLLERSDSTVSTGDPGPG